MNNKKIVKYNSLILNIKKPIKININKKIIINHKQNKKTNKQKLYYLKVLKIKKLYIYIILILI